MTYKGTFLTILIACALVGLVALLMMQSSDENTMPGTLRNINLRVGNTIINAEIAETDQTRTQGLSGRESLLENAGMLFVFDTSGIYGFWMKDMHFPIDIIWISDEKVVVGTASNTLPESYPLIYYPPSAVRYVLEVPAGYAETHNINVGSNAVFAFE